MVLSLCRPSHGPALNASSGGASGTKPSHSRSSSRARSYDRAAALTVVVLDAQQHAAARRLRDAPDEDGVDDVTEVQSAGRRRCEPREHRTDRDGRWTHVAPDDSVRRDVSVSRHCRCHHAGHCAGRHPGRRSPRHRHDHQHGTARHAGGGIAGVLGRREGHRRPAARAAGRHRHLTSTGRAVPGAHRRARQAGTGDQRVHHGEPCGTRGRRSPGSGATPGPPARAAARRAAGDQGQLPHRGSPDHGRHAGAVRLHAWPRCLPGCPLTRAGRHRPRQDEPPRAGVRHHVDQLGGWSDEESVRPVAQSGRIERWHRCRRRRQLRAGWPRHGYMRLDSHSGGAQQPLGVAADVRVVEPRRRRAAVALAGRCRTDRAQRR